MTQHAKARADFEYLETLALLEDQVELDAGREALMRDPTKERAADMYCSGIALWFGEHSEQFDDDPRVRKIRQYYENEGWI
jgi:hypothetical protein